MWISKRLSTVPRMKYDNKVSIRPMIAATIILRAASIFALSPPELIHFNAPKIINISAITEANIIAPTIMLLIIFPALSADDLEQSLLKRVSPVAHGPTLTEVAARVWEPVSRRRKRKIYTEEIEAKNLFISKSYQG